LQENLVCLDLKDSEDRQEPQDVMENPVKRESREILVLWASLVQLGLLVFLAWMEFLE
jgi:hypothetical protein